MPASWGASLTGAALAMGRNGSGLGVEEYLRGGCPGSTADLDLALLQQKDFLTSGVRKMAVVGRGVHDKA